MSQTLEELLDLWNTIIFSRSHRACFSYFPHNFPKQITSILHSYFCCIDSGVWTLNRSLCAYYICPEKIFMLHLIVCGIINEMCQKSVAVWVPVIEMLFTLVALHFDYFSCHGTFMTCSSVINCSLQVQSQNPLTLIWQWLSCHGQRPVFCIYMQVSVYRDYCKSQRFHVWFESTHLFAIIIFTAEHCYTVWHTFCLRWLAVSWKSGTIPGKYQGLFPFENQWFDYFTSNILYISYMQTLQIHFRNPKVVLATTLGSHWLLFIATQQTNFWNL